MATKRLGQERQIELATMVSFMEDDEQYLAGILENAGVGHEGDYERFKLSMAKYLLNSARSYVEDVVDTWFARDDDELVFEADDIIESTAKKTTVHDVPMTVVTNDSVVTHKDGITTTHLANGSTVTSSNLGKLAASKLISGDTFYNSEVKSFYKFLRYEDAKSWFNVARTDDGETTPLYFATDHTQKLIDRGVFIRVPWSQFPGAMNVKEITWKSFGIGDVFFNTRTGSLYRITENTPNKMRFEYLSKGDTTLRDATWDSDHFIKDVKDHFFIQTNRGEFPSDLKSTSKPWMPAYKDNDKMRNVVQQILKEVPVDRYNVPGFEGWLVGSATAAISGKTDANKLLTVVREEIDAQKATG